jgi:hypothetical protein
MANIIRDLKERGVAEWTYPDAPTERLKTFTCSHCNNVVIIRAGATATEMGGWCGMCSKPICAACTNNPACVPFERRCDAIEARDRLRRQLDGIYR